jgi:hypothetical protein
VHSLDTDVELAVERVDAQTDKRRVLGKRALGGRAANHCIFDVSEMRNADRHRTGPPPWERSVRPPIVPQQWRLFTMSLTPTTLKSAADGFDQFFAGNVGTARQVFEKNAQDPYHQLGLAVCSFLEAAMSMEVYLSHVALTDQMLMCRLPIADRRCGSCGEQHRRIAPPRQQVSTIGSTTESEPLPHGTGMGRSDRRCDVIVGFSSHF